MIKYIKNLFKHKYDIPFYCCKCGVEAGRIQPLKHDCKSIELETYEIFEATKVRPPIPTSDHEAFFRRCLELLNDEVLDRIIDDVVGGYAEGIIQTAKQQEELLEKRNKMLGADEIRQRLIKYSQQLEKDEAFDQHETI